MNSATAIERALRKISPNSVPANAVGLRTALNVAIPIALRTVAQSFAMRPPEDTERQLFEQEVVLTLAAGVGDLAAWVLANPTYLTATIDRGKIFHADSIYPLQEVTDPAMLVLPWPKNFIYFCIAGDKLKTLNTDSSLTSLTGDLTLTLVVVPTLSTLPAQFDPLLLEAMVTEVRRAQEDPKKKPVQKRPAA